MIPRGSDCEHRYRGRWFCVTGAEFPSGEVGCLVKYGRIIDAESIIANLVGKTIADAAKLCAAKGWQLNAAPKRRGHNNSATQCDSLIPTEPPQLQASLPDSEKIIQLQKTVLYWMGQYAEALRQMRELETQIRSLRMLSQRALDLTADIEDELPKASEASDATRARQPTR